MYSMTGFGASVVRQDNMSVSVELKTVNNRYFKLMLRLTENFSVLETRVESLLRKHIDRGTVSAIVRIRTDKQSPKAIISEPMLFSYAEQLSELRTKLGSIGSFESPSLYQLVMLPGVITQGNEFSDDEMDLVWRLTERGILDALAKLRVMRQSEGESMKRDLKTNIELITAELTGIEKLAPQVAEIYRTKLTERVNKIMNSKESDVILSSSDFLREVALFADKCDISEEIIRLHSHLNQFNSTINEEDSSGRKLDFLLQELFRETNTIGAKANDSNIITHVVAIKTIIEKIREMVQNIE